MLVPSSHGDCSASPQVDPSGDVRVELVAQSELAVVVGTPALEGTVAEDCACVGVPCAHRECVLVALPLSEVDSPGTARIDRVSLAELTLVVPAEALEVTVQDDDARVIPACGDRCYVVLADPARIDIDLSGGRLVVIVAYSQLPMVVTSPAP